MPRVIKRVTKRQQFDALIAARQWKSIHTAEWEALRQSFSEASLRAWLSETGLPIDQPYRGVESKTLETLEASLAAMAQHYDREIAARKVCRTVVIAAKDRARFASRNQKVDPAKRALKSEMADWMLVWLDDPAMFASWAAVRRRAILP